MIVQKYDTSVSIDGGGKEKRLYVIGVLEKRPGPITEKDGMDTLSMVEMTVKRMCFGMSDPIGL